MSSLGIYFGPKIISVVECKAKKICVSSSVPWARLNANELQDKIPIDLKLVAALKEVFRSQKIASKEAVLCLSSNDMIIRTFEIPLLPQAEIKSALQFEIKKYLPFKLEELISDFQVQNPKGSRRYSVLFLGIKKDTLDRYVSIFTQLGIKIQFIEYSAFSLLRLLRMTRTSDQGVVAVINVDTEQQEAEFTVMKNGFPLFSREIQLLAGTGDAFQIPESNEMAAEKIKTEVRISLDYYNRKFPLQGIRQILFIGGMEFQESLGGFVKDMNLPVQFVSTAKLVDKSIPFSLGMLKSYSCAFSDYAKTTVKINLLSVWQAKRRQPAGGKPGSELVEITGSLFTDFKLDMRMVVAGILICAFVYGYGVVSKIPVQNQINAITATQSSPIFINNPTITPEELSSKYSQREKDYTEIDALVRKQVMLTPLLSALGKIIPEGAWLTKFYMVPDREGPLFQIEGYVTGEDSGKESEAVYSLLMSLKKQPDFSKDFKDITLEGVDSKVVEGKKVTHFQITCRTKKGNRDGN